MHEDAPDQAEDAREHTANKVYKAWRDSEGERHVSVNGRPLRHVQYHSSELSWGYGSSGPADTSLSILANYFNERPDLQSTRFLRGDYQCWHYHQDFKRIIVSWEDTGEQVTSEEITAWLATQPRGDQTN